MKKNIIALIAILSINLTFSGFSFEISDLNFRKNPKNEIRSLLNKHNKAMDKHDIEKIKTFYDENYKSSDGFKLDDLVTMLEKTYGAYENIKYKTKINNITTYDNWALVQMSDTTKAKVYPTEDKKLKKEKMGILEGKSSYVVYLKKDSKNNWKIFSDDILMEETSLKYGLANEIDINLVAPVFVKNGEPYDLSLKMQTPDDIVALASITREEIVYPPIDTQEKYRKFPQDGKLERLVKANNKNLDEYAIASVGLTKISINETQTKANIKVLGMAYIMRRINIEANKENSTTKAEKI